MISDDVYIQTLAGSIRGIYGGNSAVYYKSNHKRPILSGITFGDTSTQAFKPHTVTISPSIHIYNTNTTSKRPIPWLLEASDVNTNQINGHVYISLLAGSSVYSSGLAGFTQNTQNLSHPLISGGSIVRCDYAGNYMRNIVANVSSIVYSYCLV